MEALKGITILDFTHVQSGPTCTQLLAWFGANVIKIERPGGGDITRSQLRDKDGVDSLYFTMLNHNKKSITLNVKDDKGKKILDDLILKCDVFVENFAPGTLDRMGYGWEYIHKLNPRIILASVKGFGPGPYEDCKVYENIAQCAGGAASTTGFLDGPPLVTGAQIRDSGTGLHLALGIVTALFHREKSGLGQKVDVAMQDGVVNLCRVKLRDYQRLSSGPLSEYSQFGQGFHSQIQLPAQEMILVEGSLVGFLNARAGRMMLTLMSTLLHKRLYGIKFVMLLVEMIGSVIPNTQLLKQD